MNFSPGARLLLIKLIRSNAVLLDIECKDLSLEDYLEYHVGVK